MMVLKGMKWVAVFLFGMLGSVSVFAEEDSTATARQVVEKFQAELIAVMGEANEKLNLNAVPP